MHLYNVELQSSTAIQNAIVGHFSGKKEQELVLGRNDRLELWKLDPKTGKLSALHSENLLGKIRAICPFRLTGGSKDYIILTADSGAITILEYLPDKNIFSITQQEYFGRSGFRRLIPGQYLTSDPRGRAVMIGASEKQKFVYILNRDSEANLTISSPLEAHKNHTICFDCVGVDVGYENPTFASLEFSYAELDRDPTAEALLTTEKNLVYYELDLGLNHVVRQWSSPVDVRSNKLIMVPGGDDGPSGVLVCSEGFITYKAPGQKESGFLFCAAESGNHQLYQFENLGDETLTPEYSSDDFPNEGEYEISKENIAQFQPHNLSCLSPVTEIESLTPTVTSMVLNLANEESPQIYSMCGQGAQSSLKVIRHGLEVTEMAVSDLPGNANSIWTIKKNITEEFDSYIIISFLDATLVLQIGEEVEEVMDSGFLNNSPTLCVQLLADGALLQVTPLALRHVFSDGRVNEWKPPANREIVAACSNTRQVVVALNRGEIILFELDTNMGVLSEWSDRFSVECDIVCLGLPSVKEGRLRSSILAIGCSDQTARIISVEPKTCFDNLSTQALSDMPESICLSELNEDTHGSQSPELNGLFLFVGLRNGLMQRTSLDNTSFEMTDTRTRFLGTKPVKLFPVIVQKRQCVLALSTRPWLNFLYQGQNRLVPMSYDMLEFGAPFASEQCPEGIVSIADNTLRIITIDRIDTLINQASIPLSYTPRGMILNNESKHFVTIESDHGYKSTTKWASELVENEIVADLTEANNAVLPPQQFGYTRGDYKSWVSCIRVLNPFTGDVAQLLELDDNEAAFSIASIEFHSNINVNYVVVGTAVQVTLKPRSCKNAFLRVYEWNEKGDNLTLLHKTAVDHVPQALAQFQGRLAAGIGSSLILYDLGKKQLLRKAHLTGLPNMISRLVVVPISESYDALMNDDGTSISKQSNRIVIADVQESIHYCIYSAYSQQFVIVCDDVISRYITSVCCLDRDTIAVSDKFGTFTVLRLPEDLLLQLRRQSTVSGHSNAQQLLTAIANKRSSSIINKKRTGASKEAPYKFSMIAQYYIGGGDVITHMQSLSWQHFDESFQGLNTFIKAENKPVIVYTTLLGQIGAMIPLTHLQTDVEFFTNLEVQLRAEQFNAKKYIYGLGDEHLFYRSKILPVKNVIDGSFCEKFAIIDSSDPVGFQLKKKISEGLDRTSEEIIKKLEDTRAMSIF
ncbi:hypothetical protein BB561_003999 [Smittium simulii]|uniref:DNA damage-binding protein 1 n=1 Tax=Smittium simulii TaxID=133385 RepID=A0A2T9YIK1_9FUNG|nr:hypothetical protein BB561_003999 [Smittium simulii]